MMKHFYTVRMDERQLSILRELGELGSVRAVAEVLHITPSAVSQQLRLLQRGVPVPLTRRDGRVLVLTDAGAALAAAGADVTIALQRARLVATELAEHPQGEVSVSAFQSAAETYFARLARKFPPDAPVQVRLTDEDVAQVGFPRLTTRVDIVIAHRMDHSPRWPRGVTATRLLHEPLDVAIPVDHPLARRTGPLSARDVAEQPWISTHADYPVVAMVEAIGATVGVPPYIVHRVNDFTLATQLVKAGAGIALIPRWTMPTPKGVTLRPLRGLAARRSIDALIRPENRIRPAVQQVLTYLNKESARISGTRIPLSHNMINDQVATSSSMRGTNSVSSVTTRSAPAARSVSASVGPLATPTARTPADSAACMSPT